MHAEKNERRLSMNRLLVVVLALVLVLDPIT